jgi:hypothetical protein
MSPLGLRSAKKKKGDDEAAAPAKAAAPAPKTRGVVVEKPQANIYTAMLIVSLVAVLIGCIFLYAEMNAYDFKMGPG